MYNHLDCNYSSSNLNSKNIKLLAILQKKVVSLVESVFSAMQTNQFRTIGT